MKVLIACEESQAVTIEFRKMGHEAYSCDTQECSGGHPEWHIQQNVLTILNTGWDLIIAHPPCTYLTCSAEWAYKEGPHHQKVKPETLVGAARISARENALEFVKTIINAKIKKKAIENPRGVISTRIMPATQYIQPNQYGEDASKMTGLWLFGLPPLTPTMHIKGRIVEHPKGSGKFVERWANQTDSGQNNLPPSADRGKLRSKFYYGWAKAMAEQWGGWLC